MTHHYHSRSRSRSRSSSRDYNRHHRRSYSDNSDNEKHLTKEEWNELKKKSLFGHSNENNPFGDDNLDTPFVWTKKEGGEESRLSKKQLVLKRLEKGEDIRKAQSRRLDDANNRMDRQRKQEEEDRQRDQKEAIMSIQKEKEFHLTQKLVGIRIRIQSGREKPLDRLLKNIMLLDEINHPVNAFDNTVLTSDVKTEVDSVEEIIAGISHDESIELLNDLDEIMLLPEMEPFLKYLAALRAVVVEHMGGSDDDAQAMHASVVEDVTALIAGKSLAEIGTLQEEITRQLAEGEGMDVDYWTAVLSLLRLESYKETLRCEHNRFMKGRDVEKQRSRIQTDESQQNRSWRLFEDKDAIEGEFSPEPLARSSIPQTRDILTVAPEDDVTQLRREREMVRHRELEALTCDLLKQRQGGRNERVVNTAYDIDYIYTPVHELQKDEEELKDDIPLPHQIYSWQQKYTPQKPLYFNKIKKGYEWNQYNQTHYDSENPPPMVIQGYRFNVFYPDLVDKSKQPSFSLQPDPKDPDWCTIRFHAGAPYEDVAFKIVNRAWDRGRKSGFKNVFESGVLHLHYDFKKYRYKFT